MSTLDRLRSRLRTLASTGRVSRFVSVGVVGFVSDIATSTTLRELGVLPELAAFVGIEVAVVVMFLLNDNWTFAGEGTDGLRATLRRFATSNLVRVGGIAVQLVVFVGVYRLLFVNLQVFGIDAWFIVGRVTGIGVGMAVNYVAESLLTWRVHAND